MPQKYRVILAAIVMQACLGGIYAWSVFVPQLRQRCGFDQHQTQLIFGTCICMFAVWQVFTGRLQDRRPRLSATLSGLFLGASYLLASVVGDNFYLLWLAVGVLGGMGIGFGYVCAIATAVKWFPEHKGLVCGLAVAGYGAGAIALSNVAGLLLGWGWDVLAIFRWVGVIYGGIVILAGTQMVLPAPLAERPAAAFNRRVLLPDRRFWALCLGIFCATLPGLAIIGQLKSIGESFGHAAAAATAGISALAVGNGTGRVAWGYLYDRLGGRRSIVLLSGMVAASVLGLILARGSAAGFLASAVIVGFCYGGSFAIFPAEVARLYGVAVMGRVYPLVLLSHGLSAPFGATLGGAAFDLWKSFIPGLCIACLAPLAGLAAYLLLSGRQPAPEQPPRP